MDKALEESRSTPQPLTALEGPRWAAFAPQEQALDAAREVPAGPCAASPASPGPCRTRTCC